MRYHRAMPHDPALPRTPTVERLDARLGGPGAMARIGAAELATLAAETGLDQPALLVACLAWAQRWALAPISNFEVGAAALAESGALYLGANLEFHGLPLAQTIHAEQAAIASAWSHGETRLLAIATSAAPCGFCRQFMLELPEPRPQLILADHGSVTLDELLPWSFGPTQLGRTPQLLRSGPHGLTLTEATEDPLVARALAAANRSSAPYSGALAGVALRLADERTFSGAVAESVAYNPTLAPMQAALLTAHHSGASLDRIEVAVLVELEDAPISQFEAATGVLAAVAPSAKLIRATAKR